MEVGEIVNRKARGINSECECQMSLIAIFVMIRSDGGDSLSWRSVAFLSCLNKGSSGYCEWEDVSIKVFFMERL